MVPAQALFPLLLCSGTIVGSHLPTEWVGLLSTGFQTLAACPTQEPWERFAPHWTTHTSQPHVGFRAPGANTRLRAFAWAGLSAWGALFLSHPPPPSKPFQAKCSASSQGVLLHLLGHDFERPCLHPAHLRAGPLLPPQSSPDTGRSVQRHGRSQGPLRRIPDSEPPAT